MIRHGSRGALTEVAVRVLVSGATGLIGSALVARLRQTGHAAIRLVRTDPDPGGTDVRWDPAAGALDPAPLEGLDAVVHLAGEDIASGAWTDAKKARIRASRVDATALLARTLARLVPAARRPRLRVGGRILRRPGRRDPDRGQRARGGLPRLRLPRLGAGGGARRARPASACCICASAWC